LPPKLSLFQATKITTTITTSKPILYPTQTNLNERMAALFIAKLAKRGACMTERESGVEVELNCNIPNTDILLFHYSRAYL